MKYWKALAETAANCYSSDDRAEVAGVEFVITDGEYGSVFAICGTNGVRDWFFNLHRSRSPIKIDGASAKVHSGFWRAATDILPEVQDWADANPGGSIVGHSLGAAVAIIAATIIYPGTPVDLCAVAAPRVGNRAFVNLLRERIPIRSRRIFGRRMDPVCHVPRFGYAALPMTWLPSKFDGRLDHDADEYVKLITE